ncbi:glycosyltransferase, partial [Vibrio vulnificus]|nr:glycosyltransferase [Vibrio vulnificus]
FIQPIILFFYIIKRRKETDIIFFDRIPVYLAIPLAVSKVFTSVKCVWGVNEFPIDFINGKRLLTVRAFSERLCFFILGIVSDLIIVISNDHKDCYQKIASKNTRLLVVPILMNTDHVYRHTEIQGLKEKTIAYGGALSSSNGVDFLLDVAKKLNLVRTDFKMTIFGPSISKEYTQAIANKIDEFELNPYVTVLQAMPNDEAIKYMHSCDVLVIPKIADKRSIGYIPSKLGDYLFSEKVVVVTNVGDVPNYINDGVNGFLVEPGDVDSFADKLSWILENYDSLHHVGKEGKKTAYLFDYKVQASKIFKELHVI